MSEKRTHTLSQIRKMKDETDRLRLRATPSEEVERQSAEDPDFADFHNVNWSRIELVVPKKKTAISIRLDEEVLDHFKAQGSGYQSRINAVLRSYVRSIGKPRRAKRS